MVKNLFTDKIFSHFDSQELQRREETVRLELLGSPDNTKKLEELATLLYYKGDYDGAIAIYKKVLSIENVFNQYSFLGYLYFEKEEYDKSISYFEKALDLNPDNAFIYFLLGNAYSRLGKIIQAVNNYDLAIFLDLDIYKTHIDFAQKYENMGWIDRAIKEYTVAFEIDPRDKNIKFKIDTLKDKLK